MCDIETLLILSQRSQGVEGIATSALSGALRDCRTPSPMRRALNFVAALLGALRDCRQDNHVYVA